MNEKFDQKEKTRKKKKEKSCLGVTLVQCFFGPPAGFEGDASRSASGLM
jgi:hypothetical protein